MRRGLSTRPSCLALVRTLEAGLFRRAPISGPVHPAFTHARRITSSVVSHGFHGRLGSGDVVMLLERPDAQGVLVK